MKRGRELGGEVDSLDMANCLMLLSKVGETHYPPTELKGSKGAFKCKTCNRQFPSFQALGGHRASHKKPKLMMGAGLSYQFPSTKPKMHECHICGLGFGIGQALGGHMRKHRAAINHGLVSHAAMAPVALGKSNSKGIDLHLDLNTTPLDIDLELDLRPPLVNCFI